MTDKEYEAIVVRIGEAFKELPDHRARYEVLAGLAGIMLRTASPSALIKNWVDTAHAGLECAAKFSSDKNSEKED